MIVGLADGSDAGAALVVDDRLVGVTAQERLDRQPRSRAFPWDAARAVLARAGLDVEDVDVVAVAGRYTPPFAARRRPALLDLAKDPFSPALSAGTLWQGLLRGTGMGALEADRTAEWLGARFREQGFAPAKVVLVDVHKCLAAAAYRCQPRDRVLTLVVHPRGDGALASVHVGSGGQLDRVSFQVGASAVHAVVDRCLAALALDPQADGPLLEGLGARAAPEPELVAALAEVLSVETGPANELVGRGIPRPERRGDRPWRLLALAAPEVAAASVVAHLRDVLLRWIATHRELHEARHLALGGAWLADPRLVAAVAQLPGVETVAAGPWTGNAALAVGAALATGGLAPHAPEPPGIGGAPSVEACRAAVEGLQAAPVDPRRVAEVLARGGVVARFAGPEGPSHGGTRSVLVRADDRAGLERARAALGRADAEEPLALLLPDAIDVARADALSGPLRWGTSAPRVPEGAIPAAAAPDGCARITWVDADAELASILGALADRTGTGALAALPLARGREPAVAAPADAAALFGAVGLDALVLGPWTVERT